MSDYDYDYECDCEYYSKERNNMSPRKENYVVEGGYYYNTEDEAIDAAKKRVNKTSDDHKVYKAIKLVSPLTPNVQVTDVT